MALLGDADVDPSTEPIVSIDLIGRPRFDLSRYDGGGICSWIVSPPGAVECLINDRTGRPITRSMPERSRRMVMRYES